MLLKNLAMSLLDNECCNPKGEKTVNEKAILKGEVNKKLVQLGSVDTCLITKIRVVINVKMPRGGIAT